MTKKQLQLENLIQRARKNNDTYSLMILEKIKANRQRDKERREAKKAMLKEWQENYFKQMQEMAKTLKEIKGA